MSTTPLTSEPLQASLFDTGIDFLQLRESESDLMSATLATNTKDAYSQSWEIWRHWCADAGRDPLCSTADSVCLFITWALSVRGLRLASVQLVLAAIRHQCRAAGLDSPVTDRVRALMTSARRRLREEPGGRAALSVDQLAKICSADAKRPIEVRNRAIVLLGFASGWRRSELAALQLGECKLVPQGVRMYQRLSKTDQEAKGRVVGIPRGKCERTCPVRALKAWTDLRGNQPGPLFTRITPGGTITTHGLRGSVVSRVLKQELRLAGMDPSRHAAHSLRAGCVTAAAEAGADLPAIMQRTGHKSVSVVMGYIRPATAFRNDPLAGVL